MGTPFGTAGGSGGLYVARSISDLRRMEDPAFPLDGGHRVVLVKEGTPLPQGDYRVWLRDAQGTDWPKSGSCFSGREDTEREGEDRFNVTVSLSGQWMSFFTPPAKEGSYLVHLLHVDAAVTPMMTTAPILRLVRPVRWQHTLELMADQGEHRRHIATERSLTEG